MVPALGRGGSFIPTEYPCYSLMEIGGAPVQETVLVIQYATGNIRRNDDGTCRFSRALRMFHQGNVVKQWAWPNPNEGGANAKRQEPGDGGCPANAEELLGLQDEDPPNAEDFGLDSGDSDRDEDSDSEDDDDDDSDDDVSEGDDEEGDSEGDDNGGEGEDEDTNVEPTQASRCKQVFLPLDDEHFIGKDCDGDPDKTVTFDLPPQTGNAGD